MSTLVGRQVRCLSLDGEPRGEVVAIHYVEPRISKTESVSDWCLLVLHDNGRMSRTLASLVEVCWS